MIHSVNPLSSSCFKTEQHPAFSPGPQVQKIVLPVITTLGEQAKIDGDRAYAICYAGCTAAVAAATLTPAGLVICFQGCLPLIWNPPLSC